MISRLCAVLVLFAGFAFAVAEPAAQPVTQPFTFSLIPHNLPQIQHGIATWGDYDGDGDLDVFLSGVDEFNFVAAVYRNDGKARATPSTLSDSLIIFSAVVQPFEPLVYSKAAWGDFDLDGDLDIVVQGSRTRQRPYDPVTTLYRNDAGAFSAVDGTPFIGLHSGSLTWGDFDNDGDEDLLLTGEDAESAPRTILYANDNGRSFDEVETGIIDVAYGDAGWADYDNDGDLDLAVAGVTAEGFEARLYGNDGGTLIERNAGLEGAGFASLDWGDYDDDGDPDLLLSGGRITPYLLEGRTHVYRNDNGHFVAGNAELVGSLSGSTKWGDYDNDGDLDAFVVGTTEVFGHRTARLYANESGASFQLKTYLIGALFASADWGDHDGDGDLDLLSSGFTSFDQSITNLYENRRQVKPDLAGVPSSTHAEVEGDVVRLSWERPVEVSSASFNLRVGTSPGTSDVLAPMADYDTGRRLVSRSGNAGSSGHWLLRDLANGTYYWSVQTLDGAFHPSAFSQEGSFHVESGVATGSESRELPESFQVYPNFPNPFTETTSLRIDLPEAVNLEVTVFDVLGASVVRLADGLRSAGVHTISWSARDGSGRSLPSGIYLYQVKAGSQLQSGRMVLVR